MKCGNIHSLTESNENLAELQDMCVLTTQDIDLLALVLGLHPA